MAGLPTNGSDGEALRAALAEHGVDAEIFESPTAAAAVERATRAADDGIEIVAAAGGDGTAYAIAGALLGRDTALGVLPAGSAMNLALALGIPRELGPAVAVLRDGPISTMDVGWVRGRPFFEIVSIGLSAEAFEQAQAVDRQQRWSAILDVLRLALRHRRTRIEVELDDGAIRTRAPAIAVANGPYTGLGLTLAPNARLDDGLLDVVIFEGLSPFGLLGHMVRVAGGRRPPSHLRLVRSAKVTITSHRPLAVRADATDGGSTPVEITIRPAALRVVVPPPDHPATRG
jgi:diacylglycerol kinase (ATP)